MAFIGSGGAKLILFGEHAVVHGHPALGLGLPGQLTVRWTPGNKQLELACHEEYQPSLRLAFERIAGHFGFDRPAWIEEPAKPANKQALPGGLLEFDSDIPVSAGLGSSGAVCVAMARAVADYEATVSSPDKTAHGKHALPEDAEIWAAAHDGERVFHGRPSGVDTGLALWQRLCLFAPQPAGLPSVSFLPRAGIDLVYGTVPREASCAANVAAALLENTSPAASSLGSLANAAMGILSKLGLSTPAMDAVLAAGLAAGATGGKLSGGGAGGAFWLACPTGLEAARIQASVIEEAHRLGLPYDAFTGCTTI
ncbi:MAG: hypothetical protein A3J97_13760 [Spirochaetes bacterium RIFOXYC1_FULL_54_7]|nr:MAG: hypothetical protein A3J97_13760 [Spirochaetes bacterium RIFOXYC1_FULL_54_7]